jgi:pseudouridine-5'-phosphate glycosidase
VIEIPRLKISDEIQEALKEKKAVVALESTLISHGLPSPLNVDVAFKSEAILRDLQVVPATVALIEGHLCVGITPEEIELLGSSSEVTKTSFNNLGEVIANKSLGATTVASTMFAAYKSGIKIFATGGIGGVHRGSDGDVSADLKALSDIPVAVVCAGVKSILDIPKTLEALETLGVPIIGYKTNFFPEFWTPGRDLKLKIIASEPKEVAHLLNTHWGIGLTTGQLVAVPIPEEKQVEQKIVENAINESLNEAASAGITGNAITPFLLTKVSEASGGLTLEANVDLILNNVQVAGEIAVQMATD